MRSTTYGADVSELRQLAARFDQVASQLDGTRQAVGSAIQISAWVGPFAVSFRLRWDNELSLKVAAAARMLHEQARRARANADDQERVSAVESGAFLHGGLWKGAKAVHEHGPRSTADLIRSHDAMNDAEDGVRIQKVLGKDGKYRYLVYIDGTGSASDGDFGLFENGPAVVSLDNATLDHVRAKIQAAVADDPDAEVALIGFSQGGLVAQRLADDGSFRTTTVLTFGSPDLPAARNYGGADVVRLEHNADVIPGTDLVNRFMQPGFDLLNLATGPAVPPKGEDVRFSAGTLFVHEPGVWGPHNHTDYGWVAEQFDKSDDPKFDASKASLSRFLDGTVVADEK